jgi:hypothetical protein
MIDNQRRKRTDTLRLPAPRTSRSRSPEGREAEEVFWGVFLVVSHDPTDAGSVVIAVISFSLASVKLYENPIFIRKMNKSTVPSAKLMPAFSTHFLFHAN